MNTPTITKKVTAKDVRRTFEGRYTIRWTVGAEITKEQAKEFQIENGYHPLGYGFYQFKSTPTQSTWTCSHSCD